ncbi:hypothetical protein ADIS_4489 [Lunatimonas lonarensis]|uniref:Uncharacterized protein n=1 Tax=Lunatimonas lonarensis TaxID=1232681 RepID=R7ZLN0_9BACT|nr:hypothetical protein ADIS_4489 [Lunatimonas lonarensis]
MAYSAFNQFELSATYTDGPRIQTDLEFSFGNLRGGYGG